VVAIWVTGIGTTGFGFWQDGRLATGALDFGCCQVYVLGYPVDVLYGGAAPGIVAGVAQINFQVPAILSVGPTVDVLLSAGGVTSHAVQLYVTGITGEPQPGQAEVPLPAR
jgi:uncharacterized protein (TIGR03437 family)